jgi:hypothetical protein
MLKKINNNSKPDDEVVEQFMDLINRIPIFSHIEALEKDYKHREEQRKRAEHLLSFVKNVNQKPSISDD